MQTCSPAMSIFSRTLNFWPISLSFGTQYSTMLLNCNTGTVQVKGLQAGQSLHFDSLGLCCVLLRDAVLRRRFKEQARLTYHHLKQEERQKYIGQSCPPSPLSLVPVWPPRKPTRATLSAGESWPPYAARWYGWKRTPRALRKQAASEEGAGREPSGRGEPSAKAQAQKEEGNPQGKSFKENRCSEEGLAGLS